MVFATAKLRIYFELQNFLAENFQELSLDVKFSGLDAVADAPADNIAP